MGRCAPAGRGTHLGGQGPWQYKYTCLFSLRPHEFSTLLVHTTVHPNPLPPEGMHGHGHSHDASDGGAHAPKVQTAAQKARALCSTASSPHTRGGCCLPAFHRVSKWTTTWARGHGRPPPSCHAITEPAHVSTGVCQHFITRRDFPAGHHPSSSIMPSRPPSTSGAI